jgi:methylated-DNA-[protein]-cysteine S-methyltransferase
MKKEKNIIKVQRYESPCGLLLLGSFGAKIA